MHVLVNGDLGADVPEDIQCVVAIVCFGAEPDNDVGCFFVNVAHETDLVAFFGPVVLDDADGVDPDCARARGQTEVSERGGKVLGDEHCVVFC